eukprot:scaffold15251_cov214-Alexandrium_tamarense.AAC.2
MSLNTQQQERSSTPTAAGKARAMMLLSTLVLLMSMGTVVGFAPRSTTQQHRVLQQDGGITTKFETTARLPSILDMSNSNEEENILRQPYQPAAATIAGASVSPLGFLVILQSSFTQSLLLGESNNNNDDGEEVGVAFPVKLTSSSGSSATTSSSSGSSNSSSSNKNNDDGSPTSSSSSNTSNNKPSSTQQSQPLPSIFQENIDQSSVTTPEALTFLQLINGVDMATPVLGPDVLSLLCVWFAFLMENDHHVLEVEDELGLSSDAAAASAENVSNEFEAALEYIRAMVRTTLPINNDNGGGSSDGVNTFLDASPWQRARVQLPRVWLRGVRLQEVASSEASISHHDEGTIGTVPIAFILECTVDDGTKKLQIPLYANSNANTTPNNLQKRVEVSNQILQELSHSFSGETSAAFISLALFHRYSKSSGGDTGDGPSLTVSDGLLKQLVSLQRSGVEEKSGRDATRYCWINSSDDGDDMDELIQSADLPMYRPLSLLKESDQRVLQHLKEQNFGKDVVLGNNKNGSSGNHKTGNGEGNNQSQNKRALTLEQQALQQKLKSAWKIATEKGDEGALAKIRSAMEDLEKELVIKDEEGVVEESSLQKIQQAMQEKDDNEEDVVGLISDLEAALEERETDD